MNKYILNIQYTREQRSQKSVQPVINKEEVVSTVYAHTDDNDQNENIVVYNVPEGKSL